MVGKRVDFFPRAGTIGYVGLVGQVQCALVGQQGDKLSPDRQAADAGIKDAYGAFIQRVSLVSFGAQLRVHFPEKKLLAERLTHVRMPGKVAASWRPQPVPRGATVHPQQRDDVPTPPPR